MVDGAEMFSSEDTVKLQTTVVAVGESTVIEEPEKIEFPAMAEGLGAEQGVADRPRAKTSSIEAGEDIPKIDISVRTTLALAYPGDGESIGLQRFREDDVKNAMEDVHVRDVIKDKET